MEPSVCTLFHAFETQNDYQKWPFFFSFWETWWKLMVPEMSETSSHELHQTSKSNVCVASEFSETSKTWNWIEIETFF